MDLSSILNGSHDEMANANTTMNAVGVNDNGAEPESDADNYVATPVDPKADVDALSKTQKIAFNANETIGTSDNSAVGGYLSFQDKTREETAGNIQEPQIIDPAKLDFIKTYTKEYDDLVSETTHAVELVLASIDKTVKDHTNTIEIPEAAMPFIDDKPEGNKVDKFDEAQQIVRLIMSRAIDAKNQAEKSAIEASRIYDNIQKFKKDTNQQIADIRDRDEFGRPRKEQMTELSADEADQIAPINSDINMANF